MSGGWWVVGGGGSGGWWVVVMVVVVVMLVVAGDGVGGDCGTGAGSGNAMMGFAPKGVGVSLLCTRLA